MGIIFWIAIAVFAAGIVAEIIDTYSEGNGIGIGFITGVVIFLVGHLVFWMGYERNYTYENKPVEFQEIDGECFIPQGNEYVVKIDGEIKIYPKSKFYTVQSDSVYDEVQIATGILDREKFDKWAVGKQVNDTTYHISKFILHRNLN